MSSLPESAHSQSSESYLYTGLVESFLGKRAALVVSTLISYGKLNVRELSKRANLPMIPVKKTLVSLIELGCVNVWEEKTYKSETVYYSFREEGALLLLYSGEIITHIDERYGNDTMTQIVQNFLSLGNLTAADYVASFGAQDKQSIVNIEKAFTTLVNDKYLIPIEKTHYSSIRDVWQHTFQKAYNRIPKTSALSELKRNAEGKSNAQIEFLNILHYEPDNLFIRDRVTTHQKVNPEISLAFSFNRFLKVRRTKQLTQFCARRAGNVSSQIYKAALSHTEKSSPEVQDPFRLIGLTHEEIQKRDEYEPKQSQLFSAKDVLKLLPKGLVLKDSVLSGPPKRRRSNADEDEESSSTSSKRVKTETGYIATEGQNGENYDEEDDDDEDMSSANVNDFTTVDQHLKILANSALPFLKKHTNGSYYVPYPDIIDSLKINACDTIVASTLGGPCARILRCVRDNRLVSEKVINGSALIKEKDIRSLTAQLVKFNFLQIQEIPKSADRAASKTVFLYRINPKHSYDFIKNNICWNMAEQLNRIGELKLENSGLITKVNRDDVKGKEMEYLLPTEITQLKDLTDRELNHSVKINRLTSIWEIFKLL
ncbi:hypothetical protein WICPIJ_003106 [Wickerhamomyces pijperi]|uniref:DNA-directed RNA polymerase III subunit RPC3 n=1 Tax=Wickerhamomyces pijperi TaxID=599730 RepID=A0A9P8QAC2_WICPI|nr:hypothetical protein WICPIJ_003106 [Wickerhamomyces pijperi]